MNENDRTAHIQKYLEDIKEQFDSGHAIEHAYRPALKQLMGCFEDTVAVNDPKHSEHGAPDFVFIKKSNKKIIRGYAEAKDITASLDKTEKTDQMQRYHGYANLFLTDYLEFRFFRNGEKYETISLGEVKNGQLLLAPENGIRLMRELEAFLDQVPEKIRSGKRLAQIMGSKARRMRDTVNEIIIENEETRRDQGTTGREDLLKIYELMKQMLVHDLDPKKFADMYAQTLVYGLFVARYGDDSPANFSRNEARDLVPKSNPFLQHFFDHIVGPDFLYRLSYIVDELCEVFRISDIADIVHRHLRIQDVTSDVKDPIIHFYEDFLQEYDSAERKKMGAYYTPVPVVKYIVRQVDKILKEDFGITKGLASTDAINYEVETGQDLRTDRRKTLNTKQTLVLPKVQILDPAVGTATFLNETIKHVHESFKGQEGRWENYVNENLIKRLYGFELMMAPYTIAHLKLGMTLKETCVVNLNNRLGVYLTNTLEEGTPPQQDLFSFGLAEAVSQESRLAAQVKSERPVMVVMGNPPYSGESSNKTEHAISLVNKYKVEPGGQQKLQERNPKWINDDYVKFIAFAEDMVAKNGEGIVGMITAHGYLDNPTFRGMRWHLSKTFDKIYVLDLHGNGNRNEKTPDGGKDENVFDIMQGVSVILAIRKTRMGNEADHQVAEVYHSEVYGTRKHKFDVLNNDSPEFKKITLDSKFYFFANKNTEGKGEYNEGVPINNLFRLSSASIVTSADSVLVKEDRGELIQSVIAAKNSDSNKKVNQRLHGITIDENNTLSVTYNPFDNRFLYYDTNVVERARYDVMKHFLSGKNIGLVYRSSIDYGHYGLTYMVDRAPVLGNLGDFSSLPVVSPLYLFHPDGTRTSNIDTHEFKNLIVNLSSEPSPEEVLDYVYAILQSPKYREKYKEFLKIDFPRIPTPKSSKGFRELAKLGKQLRELHLMTSPSLEDIDTTYPVSGTNIIEEAKYWPADTKTFWKNHENEATIHKAQTVTINKDQYFGNVPQVAWDFYIGGYQPAQKWLKDRKGRKLSSEDIEHYQKIIKILVETDRIMKEIDKVWKP